MVAALAAEVEDQILRDVAAAAKPVVKVEPGSWLKGDTMSHFLVSQQRATQNDNGKRRQREIGILATPLKARFRSKVVSQDLAMKSAALCFSQIPTSWIL